MLKTKNIRIFAVECKEWLYGNQMTAKRKITDCKIIRYKDPHTTHHIHNHQLFDKPDIEKETPDCGETASYRLKYNEI